MTKLEQIEKAVASLSEDELQAFAAWFDAMQQERLDNAFQKDVHSGLLDGLGDEAIAQFRAGKTRPL